MPTLFKPNGLFVLFVKDQEESKKFYMKILLQSPILDVPGMTQFTIYEHLTLGLMPLINISRVIPCAFKNNIAQDLPSNNAPSSELYLYCNEPQEMALRFTTHGGQLISAYQTRNWGDKVVYVADLDNHLWAFAKTKGHTKPPNKQLE